MRLSPMFDRAWWRARTDQLRRGHRTSSRVGLLAIALAVSFYAAPNVARADNSGTVTTDILNLRDGPGTWADRIDRMPGGSQVEIVDGPTDDGWYHVRYQGEDGWAYGAYLDIGGSAGWDGSGIGGGAAQSGSEHWIDVDRSSQTVTLYNGNDAVDSFWAAMGYDHSNDGFYSTAIGTYYIFDMNSALNWTDYGRVYIRDWVGFDPDRHNGFHSYSMDANGNVLSNGDGPTGGCVAVSPAAADEIYAFARIGMRVEVHW